MAARSNDLGGVAFTRIYIIISPGPKATSNDLFHLQEYTLLARLSQRLMGELKVTVVSVSALIGNVGPSDNMISFEFQYDGSVAHIP